MRGKGDIVTYFIGGRDRSGASARTGEETVPGGGKIWGSMSVIGVIVRQKNAKCSPGDATSSREGVRRRLSLVGVSTGQGGDMARD